MTSRLKILALCSIDLNISAGGLPMFWQLFMRLAELGTDIIVVPPSGKRLLVSGGDTMRIQFRIFLFMTWHFAFTTN